MNGTNQEAGLGRAGNGLLCRLESSSVGEGKAEGLGERSGGLGAGEGRPYLLSSARKRRLSCGRRCGSALYCLSQQALVL